MTEYRYTKRLLLVYLLFLPTSLFAFCILVLVGMYSHADEVYVFAAILGLWAVINAYLLLRILRTRIVISRTSLLVWGSFQRIEISYDRIVAIKTYHTDEPSHAYSSIVKHLLPLYRTHYYLDLYYKDYAGRKRHLNEDITNYANRDRLIDHLENQIKHVKVESSH